MNKHKCADCGKETTFIDKRCDKCYNSQMTAAHQKCVYCGRLFSLDKIEFIQGLAVCETDKEQLKKLLLEK